MNTSRIVSSFNDKPKATASMFDSKIVMAAIRNSFLKLDPRVQIRNPVMFCVYIGSLLTTFLWIRTLFVNDGESSWFVLGIAAWLWFTVLFANFAEAIAEGHGKAQAASLRRSKTAVMARKLMNRMLESRAGASRDESSQFADRMESQEVSATELELGDRATVKSQFTLLGRRARSSSYMAKME